MYIYMTDMYVEKRCPYKGCAVCKIACQEKQSKAMKYLLQGASTGSAQLNKALDVLKMYDYVYIMKLAKNTEVSKKPYWDIKGYMVTGGSDVHTEFVINFYWKEGKVEMSMFLEDEDVYR